MNGSFRRGCAPRDNPSLRRELDALEQEYNAVLEQIARVELALALMQTGEWVWEPGEVETAR